MRRHSTAGIKVCALLLLASLPAACQTSNAWNRSLARGPDTATARPGAVPTVRRVQWERIERTLRELEAEAAASDVYPDEWSAEQRAASKAKLLRGLQVSQNPAEVLVLGTSQFSTTDDLSNAEQNLRRVGSDLGADLVVWSSRVLGKADKIISQPVTTSTWGTGWWRDDDSRNPRDFYANSTTWIPFRITVDQTAGVAYYLRIRP